MNRLAQPPALLLLPLLVLLSGCIPELGAQTDADQAAGYHHQVASITPQTQAAYQVPRRFTGTVTARQRVDLGFELAGKLTAIKVDEGDRVNQGQLLAEQDTALLHRERDELLAQREETRAALTLVEQNLARVQALRQKNYASERESDELVSQRRVTEAALARLEAALAANQTRLDKTRLLAPFDAVVSRRLQDTGAVLASGAPLLRLIQSGPMEAKIGVPVRLLAAVPPGGRVSLALTGQQSAPLHGRVLSINPDLNPSTRTVAVRIALQVDQAAATVGPLVDGDLIDLILPETVPTDGAWLPLGALTNGLRGLWSVYALVPTEQPQRYRLERRDVQVEYADAERAYVSGALAPGERVVATGLQRLVPGQVVRIAGLRQPGVGATSVNAVAQR